MKRILALLLTLILLVALFPAGIVAQAETVTKEGFYLVNWGRDFDTGDYENVYWMPYTWINASKFDANSESINITMYIGDESASDVDDAADLLYDEFKNRPVGSRYINLAAMATVFNDCVKDAVDMEDGVRLVKDWLERFLSAYKKLGGELDGIAIDLEYNYAYNFYLESYHYNNSNSAKKNLNIYNDIVANDVYQRRIRPQLVEYEKQGLFKFYQNPNPAEYSYRSEIWTVYRYDSSGGDATCRSTWNRIIQELLVEYINEATFEPLIKYYPDAILSDYGTADSYGWHKSMSTSGGTTGTSTKAGNASNESFYGSTFSEYYFASYSGSKTRQLYTKPASYNKAVFDPTDAYTRALFDVNTQKRLLASTQDKMGAENAHVNVWVPFFHYASTTKSYGNSPYFAELIYHFGLTNPEPFFGYVIKSEVENKGKNYDDDNMGDYDYVLQVNDELLKELTRVAGASDRKAIVTPLSWNEGYILSGMYAGGRNIWRLTPDTNQVSVEDFKVKDKAPTFTVNGVTITFPRGRIIADSKITQIGTCGYWIETPADATPVVTTTDSRYANDPSFMETFSNYNTGAFTDSASSMIVSNRPDTYWAASGTAEIRENGDNKALALTGNTTLTNSKVPEKITAADVYAKQQAWEVIVTLPASDKYSAVSLFQFDDGDTDTSDAVAGFALSGGQVKYNQNGSLTALTGVDISAGGTYTFKRVLDFRNAHTSSYYVYDASGNLLGSAENVAINTANITLPVYKITLATTGASDAVVLDDYKLYPTGVTTELEVYNATTGRKITDTTAASTENTAYRLSWMNASSQYKVARIYDAKTGTILKKVDMAPGMDGVVTGVVEASASKSVLIEVDVQDGTAPKLPNYDNGNFRWTATVAEELGLAVGEKPAPEDNGTEDGGNTDEGIADENAGGNTDGAGEEGGNIFDIIGGNPDTNNGGADGDTSGESNVGGADQGAVTDTQKGLSGGVIALIVIGSVIVLLGGALAVFLFVVKPKLTETSPAWLLKLSQWIDLEKLFKKKDKPEDNP